MTENNSDNKSAGPQANGTGPHDTGEASADERLAALLGDLNELAAYLTERGRHTYELAQRFMEHARQERDTSSRAYDERQATMLEYQHYIWHEIAGLVNKLLVRYGESAEHGEREADTTPENGDK